MSSLILNQDVGDITAAVSPEALEERDVALVGASFITEVTSHEQLEMAVDALRPLVALGKACEKARQALKGPVLDIGRKIDGVAQDYIRPVSLEIDRIKRLSAVFHAAEEKKRQAALEEERRIRAEMEKEAEEKRREIAAQALRDAEAAKSLDQVIQIEAKAEEAAKVVTQATAEAQADLIPMAPAPTVVGAKGSGVSAAKTWKFEILDLRLLAEKHPDLVDIVPRGRAIQDRLRAGTTNIEGLRCWEETEIRVRA